MRLPFRNASYRPSAVMYNRARELFDAMLKVCRTRNGRFVSVSDVGGVEIGMADQADRSRSPAST